MDNEISWSSITIQEEDTLRHLATHEVSHGLEYTSQYSYRKLEANIKLEVMVRSVSIARAEDLTLITTILMRVDDTPKA